MRSDKEGLLDMLEAIESVERYASLGHDAFIRDERSVYGWLITFK